MFFLKGEKCARKACMVEPSRQEAQGKGSKSAKSEVVRQVLDTSSIFVATVVEILTKRGTEDAVRVADLIRRQGVMTGRGFQQLAESTSDPAFASEVLRAYAFIAKGSIESDFPQGLPALVTIAQRSLTSRDALDEDGQRRLQGVLSQVLRECEAGSEVSSLLRTVSSAPESVRLQSIATLGFQDRAGYWQALGLLCALHPDTVSLEYALRAVDRLGNPPYDSSARRGVRQCLSALFNEKFVPSFEYLARALGDAESRSRHSLRGALAAGVSDHAPENVTVLCGFIRSDDPSCALLALRVCVEADKSFRIALSSDERDELATAIRSLLGDAREEREALRDSALIALGHISRDRADVERVGGTLRERLTSNGPSLNALALSYAHGFSRIHEEYGIVAFRPLSERRIAALSSNPPLMHRNEPVRSVIGTPDPDRLFDELAIEIASAGDFGEALTACRRSSHVLDPRALRPRSGNSSELFFDIQEAARFSHYYAELAEKGPSSFAAVLLPELLSALERGRREGENRYREFIGLNALRSLSALTSVFMNNPKVRELSMCRLSASDYQMIASFHHHNEERYPLLYPELGLAVFALRSAIEDDSAWQKQLLRWWNSVHDRVRQGMDKNALAFVSVVAERLTPGSAIQLLRRLSLVNEDEESFHDIAVGLMVDPRASVERTMSLVRSPKSADLARGFLISQLIARELRQDERDLILEVARRSLDELGLLSVDAACTIGALSNSRDDALLLINKQPPSGISEKVFRASCLWAASRVMRNRER